MPPFRPPGGHPDTQTAPELIAAVLADTISAPLTPPQVHVAQNQPTTNPPQNSARGMYPFSPARASFHDFGLYALYIPPGIWDVSGHAAGTEPRAEITYVTIP